MRNAHRLRSRIHPRRWAAYALAGAATTLASGEDVGAGIVYSGILNADLGAARLRLQGGEQIAAGARFSSGSGGPQFDIAHGTRLTGSIQARFAIGSQIYLPYTSSWALANLSEDIAVSAVVGDSTSGPGRWAIVRGTRVTGRTFFSTTNTFHFGAFGSGFAAMRFDVGHGMQYAWLRINESTLIDWAYGTPGQSLLTGQTAVPESGSLGLLAVGAAGLLAWRGARRRGAIHPA